MCSALAGEVSPVLARWALSQVSVLCGGPHGGVQHASVHPPGVQSYRCQGWFMLCLKCPLACCIQTTVSHHTTRFFRSILSVLLAGSGAQHVLSTCSVCWLVCVFYVNVCNTTGSRYWQTPMDHSFNHAVSRLPWHCVCVCVFVYLCIFTHTHTRVSHT